MNEEQLGYLPATQLAPMIRQKKISPVEVMTALLARMEKLEPKINAMAAIDPELSLAGARAGGGVGGECDGVDRNGRNRGRGECAGNEQRGEGIAEGHHASSIWRNRRAA